jgi:predicted secreted protein
MLQGTQISEEANAVLSFDKELIQVVSRNPFPTFKQMIKSGAISINGFLKDATANVALMWQCVDVEDNVTIRLKHTSGSPYMEGSFIISNLDIQLNNPDGATFSMNAELSGDITYST